MLIRPWYLDPDCIAEGKEYYNLTQSDPGWSDYVGTLSASNKNSFEIPCLAGYIIIGGFCLVVACASLLRLLGHFGMHPLENLGTLGGAFQKNIPQAPTIGKKHSVPWRALGGVLSFHMPLRGQTLLLFALSLANLVPLLGLYSPYSPNLDYPNDRFSEICRYLADRSAILATTQITPTILLAGRNNPVTFLSGASFSTSQFWHRWFARWTFVNGAIHAIGMSVLQARAGTYRKFWAQPFAWHGGISIVGMSLATFLSLRYLRQKAYEWFVILHILFAACALAGLYMHIHLVGNNIYWADFLNFCLAASAFWSFDRFIRLARMILLNFRFFGGGQHTTSRQSCGEISLLPGCQNIVTMRIRLEGRAAKLLGDGAGRFVQVWIPRVQSLSSHPFTVLRIEKSGESAKHVHMHLAMRVHKGITERLAQRARQNGGSCQLTSLVEGLYGQPVDLQRYQHVSLIAGGMAITAMLPYFWQASQNGSSVALVWIERNIGATLLLVDYLNGMQPSLMPSKHEATAEKHVARPKIHVILSGPAENGTRPLQNTTLGYLPRLDSNMQAVDSISKDSLVDNKIASKEAFTSSLETGPEIAIHEPVLARLREAASKHGFELAITAGQGRAAMKDVLQADSCLQDVDVTRSVVACGPPSMCDDIRHASRLMNLAYHEELFDW